MAPTLLSLSEVLEIHQDQIQRYGGDGGVRELGLLKSPIAMPAATFGGRFLHADLHEMAAAYVFHIVRNHPFVDGNKRVGIVASIVSLQLNGVELDASDEELESLVLATAQGQASKSEIAEFLRSKSHAT